MASICCFDCLFSAVRRFLRISAAYRAFMPVYRKRLVLMALKEGIYKRVVTRVNHNLVASGIKPPEREKDVIDKITGINCP